MNDIKTPKKPLWKSKAVIFATIFSCLFLLFFYMAVSNEPDYMPSQQNKPTTRPTAHTQSEQSNHDMQMPDQQIKNMPHNDSHTESSH
jgi:hypothetical protein